MKYMKTKFWGFPSLTVSPGPAPGIGGIGSRLGRQILGGANLRKGDFFLTTIHYTTIN